MIFTGVCDTAGSRKAKTCRLALLGLPPGSVRRAYTVVCPKMRRTSAGVENGDGIPLIRQDVVPHTTTARTETRLLEHQQHAVLRRIKSIIRMQRNACTPMQRHHQTDHASIAPAHLDRSVRLFVLHWPRTRCGSIARVLYACQTLERYHGRGIVSEA